MTDPKTYGAPRRTFLLTLAAAGGGATLLGAPFVMAAGNASSANIQEPRLVPAATVKSAPSPAAGMQTAIVAGGCFWGVQGVFQHVKGVQNAVSGYAGGTRATAVYEIVGTGRTGHAEAVRITFDPRVIPYEDILRIFFSVATDPTQLNQQFPDNGPQYRNALFTTSPDQERVAKAYIAQLNQAKAFSRPIVTTVGPNTGFYPAEAEHQDYLTLNPRQPYIVTYDLPKIEALRRLFPSAWRAQPVLVRGRV